MLPEEETLRDEELLDDTQQSASFSYWNQYSTCGCQSVPNRTSRIRTIAPVPTGNSRQMPVSLPIGGGTVSEAYAADTAIVDVPTGKLMWSGRATGPTGSDTTSQLTELTRVTFESLQTAGML